MTFQDVLKARGRHYRPFTGARVGSLVLVYDDITVEIIEVFPGMDIPTGRVRSVQRTDPEKAASFLKGIPYADERAAEQNDAPELPAGRKSTPPAATR